MLYGQLKLADAKAKAIAEELPDREEGGLIRGIKHGLKGGARSGLMGAGLGGLIGGPIGAIAGGTFGLGVGGAANGLKGLLFDESKADYAKRLATKHPELVTALIKRNKAHTKEASWMSEVNSQVQAVKEHDKKYPNFLKDYQKHTGKEFDEGNEPLNKATNRLYPNHAARK